MHERAKSLCNPLNSLGNSIFIDSLGVQLANIDYIYNLIPKENQDPFHFVDLNGIKGGMSEYILWRKSTNAIGFGLSFNSSYDENVFKKYKDFHMLNYDKNGMDFILQNTSKTNGVDLVVSGGVNLITEMGSMFSLLKKDGQFVLRLSHPPLSCLDAGLIYILYQSFQRISIVKPLTIHPCDSSRYIICQGFLKRSIDGMESLFKMDDKKQIHSVVSLKTLLQDDEFVDYLQGSNIKYVFECNLVNIIMNIDLQ